MKITRQILAHKLTAYLYHRKINRDGKPDGGVADIKNRLSV